MQKNRWNIWDVVFKPSWLDPLVVNRCLVIWIVLSNHALSINYNSWKKLDEYSRWDLWQLEYSVIEEWREWIKMSTYSEETLYETRESAMEYVYERAQEVLWVTWPNGNSNDK